MNLVIQHSIWAMNASRMLGINDRKITKSGEKLSSGYKINRAADDAAGLSISEKIAFETTSRGYISSVNLSPFEFKSIAPSPRTDSEMRNSLPSFLV